MSEQRLPFDHEAYEARIRASRCFLCCVVDGQPTHQREHVVYRDDHLIALLSQPPVQRGHLLVAPLEHAEHVVTDFALAEYLRLQAFIHHLGLALPKVLSLERLYVFSMGSQQGNSHVHWHVVPLPPGVPPSQQQFHSVMLENGYLDLNQEEQAELASAIRRQIEAVTTASGTAGAAEQTSTPHLSVQKAVPGEKDVVGRLVELNAYEFSRLDHRSIGADGRYGYHWLDAYFSERGRTAYLLRLGAEIAGFALVSQLRDGEFSMSEFLVLPKFRRTGVGIRAARRLFDTHRGNWQVSQVAGHASATAFWRRAIAVPFDESVDHQGRTVQRFTC